MASGAMLTRLATGTPASWLITCYLTLGVGTGMVNPAITNTAVSGGAAVLLLAIITTGRWAKATAEPAASRTAPGSPKVPVSS